MPKEAMFYEKLEDHRVRCVLCPHHCVIKPGHQGICRSRVNEDGKLIARSYAQVASLALDPIEKKPLYHFYPGKNILSTGTFGCNLSCAFCQNYHLVHGNPDTHTIGPQQLLELAGKSRANSSIGVAFTYNEPIIWYEYIMDSAVLLKEKDLKVVMVTNGYIETEPLHHLLPYVDAMNIDVKAFKEEFYKKLCKAGLSKVMETVEKAAGQCHIEITSLIIPGENDDLNDLKQMARWIAGINPHIPLHLSRYHPAYRMDRESTPAGTLEQARQIAREYLKHVYVGNLAGPDNNTYCTECEALLIKRDAYYTNIIALDQGHCAGCGKEVSYIVT
ncbi:radical sam, pyruvate-formate lyase-activating enzyme like [hydrocarbon metagenome]|uniref:Radical sam, pyruvate-formate lyase-activating enzyme like n=1 Tax=hydrocarbon metagenome TaxID=938273 RepID=A0A0W8E693_9ZZZZ